MFGSILDLWIIQPMGPGTLGSVRGWLTVLAWVIGWPLPSSLGHLYPAYPIGRTGSRLNVRWLGSCPSPSLEDLPGHRRWPVQTMYLLLLGVLAVHPCRFLGDSLVLAFYLTLNCPHLSCSRSVLSPSIPHSLIAQVSMQPQFPHEISSQRLRETQYQEVFLG